MPRFLAAIFLLTVPAPAQFTVRIVTISAPDLPAARACFTAPAEDDDLRRELLPYFAEPVCDKLLRCGPGESKLEAREETPYPTEFDRPKRPGQTTIPSAFAVKNVGLTAEVDIKPGTAGEPVFITVSLSKVTDDGRSEFPLRSSPAAPPIIQPRFIVDHAQATFSVNSGKWRLIGITRPLARAGKAAFPGRALLTFVQVCDTGDAKAAVAVPGENRLHLFSFRIPAVEGTGLALRNPEEDAALLDRLLQRAERGEVSLTGHAAVLTPPDSPSAAPTPKPVAPSDPFTPSGGGMFKADLHAEAASILEFPYATEFDPDPSAFAMKNTGHFLTVRGSVIEWEALDGPFKMIPCLPETQPLGLAQTEFATQSLKLQATLPPGAARMAGAMLLPGDGGSAMMQVYFLKSAGPAAPVSTKQSEVHCAAFSLTPVDAGRLAAVSQDRQFATLQSMMTTGAASLLAWQSAAGSAGTEAAVRCYTETPTICGNKLKKTGDLLSPRNTTLHTLGTILELKHSSGTLPLTGEFSVTLNRPPLPSSADFRAAAAEDRALPEFDAAKLSVNLKRGGAAALKPGVPLLQFFPPAKVPADRPEQGRRQVVLILKR